MFTWKPIDQELIVASAKETGAIVTAENHQVNCGLGSAVAQVVAKNCPVPMEMIGVQNRFGPGWCTGLLAGGIQPSGSGVWFSSKKAVFSQVILLTSNPKGRLRNLVIKKQKKSFFLRFFVVSAVK